MMNNSNSDNNAPVARREVTKVLPVRRAPSVVDAQPRPGFRVLQSGRAPAQLSLFLRPANAR
jgi:hypothetical protein